MKTKKITVVAPACAITRETADKILALNTAMFAPNPPAIHFHPQCFLTSGHFAGSDAERTAAFLEAANDPSADAVWFARGGYGACRLDDAAFKNLNEAARRKTYLGYSDMGALLARLYREKIGRPVHGPMPSDVNRAGGDEAILRALKFLVEGSRRTLEPSCLSGSPAAAFNLTILAHLMGTDYQPDLADHLVMLEDIGEYHYRLDRAFFTITSNKNMRRAAGIMLGRVSEIPENKPDFQQTEEKIAQHWCVRAGIAYLGRADIGHDSDNKVVPFGALNIA